MIHINISSCCSVTKSCPTLCKPTDCSTLGFPVLHQLPELAQTHIHWVCGAFQPSHYLSPPSPPAFNLSQHESFAMSQLFTCIRWPKYCSFSFSVSPSSEYSELISFRTHWFDLPPRDSQESSLAPQFKRIHSSVLSLLYGPTLTSVHDHWKNHTFDYMDLCWQSNVSGFSYTV